MSAPTAPVRIFVPIDAAALSVGAEAVAHAVSREAAARGIAIDLVRNGSRGMLWLEPLVEVETPQGRIAYGPVAARDVEGLFDAGLVQGGEHPLRLGLVDDLDWMKRQQRLTFARVGVIDPLSLSDYRAYDGAGADGGGDRRNRPRIRPARSRRRGLPDRDQVEDRARCERGPEIHRL